MLGIVLPGGRLGNDANIQSDNAQSPTLQPADDFANQPTLDTVRFDDHKSSLRLSHKFPFLRNARARKAGGSA